MAVVSAPPHLEEDRRLCEEFVREHWGGPPDGTPPVIFVAAESLEAVRRRVRLAELALSGGEEPGVPLGGRRPHAVAVSPRAAAREAACREAAGLLRPGRAAPPLEAQAGTFLFLYLEPLPGVVLDRPDHLATFPRVLHLREDDVAGE